MNDLFYMPTKVIHRNNCILENKELIREFGNSCLLVTGKSSANKSGVLEDLIPILEGLNIDYFIFNGIEENPTFKNLDDAYRAYKDKSIDFIIGIGGGSPMDAAKMIGVLYKNPDHKGRDLIQDGNLASLPLITIPTTAGTGSETTPYAIITDHVAKTKVNCAPKVFPSVSLVDTKYFLSMPNSVLRTTAIDALCHLSEGYICKKANGFSDFIAEEGFRLYRSIKERLVNNSLELEDYHHLVRASTLAGMVISHSGTGLPHGMGYYLTYYHDVPHGKATALFLGETLRMHLGKFEGVSKEYQKAIKLLDLLGFDDVDAFKAFISKMIGTYTLNEQELLDYALEMSSNKRKLAAHDFPISYDDILNCYKESLK